MHAQPRLGPVATAMEVCDNVEGNKIGTVARLYRRGTKEDGADAKSDRRPRDSGGQDWVSSGGASTLYIPLSAVADATSHSLYLARPKREFDHAWRKKLSDLVPVR